MNKAHLFISGFVQGVGFRQFVKKTAQAFELTGWVKNTENGRVEVMFEGEENNIKKAIQECEKGPFLAEVKDISIEWPQTPETFAQFNIVSS